MLSDRDKVLEATDLVALVGEHVALKPKGREHVGLCPFHDDRTPSLAVVTHKGNHFYKCFACGAAGNAIDFMMQFHRMEFPEALRALAQRAGIALRPMATREGACDDPRQDRVLLRRATLIAQRFFRSSLSHSTLGAAARAAIESRQMDPAMVERFGLGAAPDGWDHFVKHLERLERHGAGAEARGGARSAGDDDGRIPREVFHAAGLLRDGSRGPIDGFRNRITFPICDELGNPIAFGARTIDPGDEPKYLNSPESAIFHKGRSLYGLHLARRAIIERGLAIVCEGYTDCMACHAAGFEHAVATLGTSLTREHARALQRLSSRVVLLFDGDEAGQRAADRAVEVFFAEPIDVLICTLPDGMDPDELLRADDGRARFDAAIASAVDAVKHLVRRFEAQWRGAAGLSARQQRLEAMLSRLSELGLSQLGGLRRRLMLASLADLTGLRPEELERAIPASPHGRGRPPARAEVGRVAQAGAVQSVDGIHHRTPDPKRRARVEAERNLLAYLVADPSLASESLPTEDGPLPITEAFPSGSFLVPSHQRIAASIWQAAESGNRHSLQSLIADLPDAIDKSTASDLFSTGTRRMDPQNRPERTPQEAVRLAAIDLERLIRRERWDSNRPRSDRAMTPGGLLEALEQLRASGPRPAAIASSPPWSGRPMAAGLESSPNFSPQAPSASLQSKPEETRRPNS